MADQAISAVSTSTASTVAATSTTLTLAPDTTIGQPIQDPVAANEEARTAAQNLWAITLPTLEIWLHTCVCDPSGAIRTAFTPQWLRELQSQQTK